VLVFTAAYFVTSRELRSSGEMRATNGRYFFAVLPLGLPSSAGGAGLPSGKRRSLVLPRSGGAPVRRLLSSDACHPFYRSG
jgi:hypothetical protein